jgi:hypothetical protein
MHLRLFKDNGLVNYGKTLLIPSAERITALTVSEAGYKEVYTVLVVYLQQTFNNLNLKRGFNEDQLLELADMIIEESREDNLSLEDVMLFLQQLVAGKAGKIYDRMDIPVFFELFEGYRQDRHLAMMYLRYEAESNYKAAGDTTRTSDGLAENDNNTRQVMADYYRQSTNGKDTIPPTSAA